MATGTGKTRTAIRIIQELYDRREVDQVLVITYGNDLLDQWYRELLMRCTEALLFGGTENTMNFAFHADGGSAEDPLVSRDGERIRSVLRRMRRQGERTLLIFDEVTEPVRRRSGRQPDRSCRTFVFGSA